MDDISDEKYTYDAGIPWPETAEARIVTLEAQAIADDARIEKLEANFRALQANQIQLIGMAADAERKIGNLEAIIHKYINQDAEEPE